MKDPHQKKESYSKLYRNFILLIFVTSLLPHLLVGWGIYHYSSNFSITRLQNYFQGQVEDHRKIIEFFLRERASDLEMVVETHPLNQLRDYENLNRVFGALNRNGHFFIDLGVIGEQGKHLSYVGPYQLMDKDYSQTFWFKEVMKKGVFISDMFMGYRNSPHFIIAFLHPEKGHRWILRATIDTEYFRSLVENVRIGKTGEAYLVNQSGIFQTSPYGKRQDHGKDPPAHGKISERQRG